MTDLRAAAAPPPTHPAGTVAALGIPRKTFYDKLARHGIDQAAYRPAARGRG